LIKAILTHFWDVDGTDLHLISLETDGAFETGETIEICNNPYLIELMVRKVSAPNESLHIFARMITQ
jgi:hypothetical protein